MFFAHSGGRIVCLLILLLGLTTNLWSQKLPSSKPGVARGVILDQGNNPITGAHISEEGTTNITTSNARGEFELRLKSSSQIQVSHVGKKTQMIRISTEARLMIVLEDAATNMDEVVVVGYGTQEKKDLTGAIGSVKASDFKNQPIVNVNEALAGQLAGVNVMNTSGTPGGGIDIQIRGISTIGAGSNPLYVVDGNAIQVEMNAESNPLGFLNPNDIESVEILKDAAAAAIYGSRASNGVVLITTKSGKTGKAKVQYNVKLGSQEVFNKIDALTGREFATLAIEARNNTMVDQGNSPLDGDAFRSDNLTIGKFQEFLNSGKTGTDWQDAIFRKAIFQDHQLSVSGGTENVKYLISGNFLDQQGIVKNSGFKRYSLRGNVDAKVSKRLDIGLKLSPTYTNQDFLPAAGRYHDANAGIIQGALLMNPMLDIYSSESYTGYTMGINQGYGMANVENPVAKINLLKDWRRNFGLVSNAYANYKFNRALSLKITGASTILSQRSDRIIPSTLGAYALRPPRDNAIVSLQNIGFNWQANAQLSYNQRFGKHQLSAVAVHERQMQQDNVTYAKASATWTDDLIIVDGSLPNVLREGSSSISEWALSSWIARANYNFDNRYLLSGSIRADGSSRFADRWGVFPSVAAAWRLSNEKFLKRIAWLSDLKLRSSFGLTGNNSIGNYDYMSFMGGASYVLGSGGESVVPGVRWSSYGNKDLTWEHTRQVDAGVDIAFFKNRIGLTIDYYNKQTRNLLLELQTPANLGFTSIMTNIGKVENKGWEFTANGKILTGDLQWNSNFNIAFNRQKVLALGPEGDPIWGNSVFYTNTHITQIGQPMGLFYGLKVIGIYQNQQQVDELPGIKTGAISRPGEFIYENVNAADNIITVDDRTVIGNPNPDFTFGFRNNFSYKRFSLGIMIRGSYGAEILNFNYGDIHYLMNTNFHRSALNRWQSEEQPGDGKTPRVSRLNRATLGLINSSFVEDASFLNIQNMSLGFDVPQKILRKVKAEALSIQFSVQNLFMFTRYTGYNPEGGINVGASLAPGVDWGRYPLSRTYTLGINLGL